MTGGAFAGETSATMSGDHIAGRLGTLLGSVRGLIYYSVPMCRSE